MAYINPAPQERTATLITEAPFVILPPAGDADMPHLWRSQVPASDMKVALPDGSSGSCWLYSQSDWDQFAQEAADFVRALSLL